MRRAVLTIVATTAVLGTAVAVYIAATLPPRARRPPAAGDTSRLAWGAYHVHSNRSDGSGTVDDIAAAAARAGLAFVILTDHGDATRPPDPPQYRHGVLCIDLVEVNSNGGHVVALGLAGPSPFPLAGETRDVIEDIHRMGGLAIAAHPDSSRTGLRWRAANVPFDGIEWLNADSEWRARAMSTVAGAAARAIVRPAESLASLFQAPSRSMLRWDAALRSRPVFSIAALDAHARVGADDDGGGEPRGPMLAFPSYEALFRTVAQVVELDRPMTHDAVADAAQVLAAIGGGRSYSVVRAFIDVLPGFTFTATHAGGTVRAGAHVPPDTAAMLHAEVGSSLSSRLVLYQNGQAIATGTGQVSFQAPAGAAAYRVEAFIDDRPIPWLVANPIYFDGAEQSDAADRLTAAASGAGGGVANTTAVDVTPAQWRIEADTSSTATLRATGESLTLRYHLGTGPPSGQYVALATGAGGDLPLDRIEFVAQSTRPMRISVQVRLPGGRDGQRWRRSVYVDPTPSTIAVRLADLEPVDRTSPLRPIVARVQSVLLVVDTLNARPGAEGEFTVRQVRLVSGRANQQ